MTSIRLIALDVDGTILDSDGSLSSRVKRAVQEAKARGVVVALATARRWTGAEPFARELGLSGSLILYDGALVRGFPDGQTQLQNTLDATLARGAAKALAAQELQVVAQYSHPEGERLVASEDPPHPKWMDGYLTSFRGQTAYAPLDRLVDTAPDILRLVSFGPVKRLREALDALGDALVGRQILPLGSYGIAELTVFSPEASKGAGLRWLARRLDIPLEQTLAIGDGVNDISMLREAGVGVAMGNAAPEVRQEADVVTATNDDDGAALAIERYVLDADIPPIKVDSDDPGDDTDDDSEESA